MPGDALLFSSVRKGRNGVEGTKAKVKEHMLQQAEWKTRISCSHLERAPRTGKRSWPRMQ